VVTAALLLLTACGGGTAETTTTTAAKTTTTEATTATTTSSGAVSDLEGVEGAVIQIVAEGSFVDPEVGQVQNAAGSGSGFIIDPSGIAVTNNHVVTGAALLRVYVGGEDEARNAKVLGVSECSDLAVIDIEGEGYPYLEWYDGDVTAGMDIYAAGFPLGNPEYTLLEGIVSKEDAGGESSWASVDSVIEHSADTLPGNSGGPIVTPEGKVLAVNYAGDPAGQSFAIGLAEVLEVLDELQAGNDVDSIGVNGSAVLASDVAGIWVAAVQSGSPAAEVGVEPGDIITSLEGLILSTDGTMSDYCDILRSHDRGDELKVEVLRYGTSEVLEGTLNSGEELEVSFSFAQEFEDEVGGEGLTTSYDEYVTVTDDTGALTMDVPAEWSDVNGSAWVRDDVEVGPAVTASPDLDGYYETWETPGVFFGASAELASEDENALLDGIDFSADCEYGGRETYSDPLYSGAFDVWQNCGGVGTTFITLAAFPENRAFVLLLQVQVVSDADLEALDTILNTFVGNL
jgi:serine protease Do